CRGGRAVIAGRDRDRAVTKSAELRTARRTVSGEALSRSQSRRRCARGAGVGGRGLPADPTIPRTRGGANPSQGTKRLSRLPPTSNHALGGVRLSTGEPILRKDRPPYLPRRSLGLSAGPRPDQRKGSLHFDPTLVPNAATPFAVG